jgi:phosphohistidine phosphatase
MNIYLIRHAEAVGRGEAGIQSDEERPLTDAGRRQARELAAAFQRHQIQVDAIVTSGLVRAVQTADELAGAWGTPHDRMHHTGHLAPGGKPRKLARFLEELGVESVALVGHQPDIDELTGWLIGSKKAGIDIAKAGAAYVQTSEELGKGVGALLWLITPDWAAKAGPAPGPRPKAAKEG